MTDFIVNEKGEEVISERHQKDYQKSYEQNTEQSTTVKEEITTSTESFTDVNFDDI